VARRLQQRPPARPAGGDSDLPPELQAGPCVEVWAPGEPWEFPDAGPWAIGTARRRWYAARDRWLTEQGIGLRDYRAWPAALRRGQHWSYARLAAAGPDVLAATLAWRDLPRDWVPRPVPRRPEEAA
jgi:hypothetical protein